MKQVLLFVLLSLFMFDASAQTKQQKQIRIFREKLQLVEGDSLLDYKVVVGSFGYKSHADTCKNSLIKMGYKARIAINSSKTYRVIAGSFSNESDAKQFYLTLEDSYPDAFIILGRWD